MQGRLDGRNHRAGRREEVVQGGQVRLMPTAVMA